MKKLGLFPRLLIAFLLVIGVAAVTLYAAGLTFGPVFLERHLVSMGLSVQDPPPGTETMLSDLRVNYREALSQSLLLAVVVAVLIAGGVSFFITRQVVTPLQRMGRASERIATGNYRERLDVSGPGEVGSLAQSFNRMAGTLEAGEAQRTELIRNLAHEVRTPLTNLRGYLEGLQEGLFEADEETFEASRRQLARLERLLDDLSLLSRVESQQEQVTLERVALETICLASLQAVRPQYLHKGVDLHCEPISPDLRVEADPLRSEQVLTNLLGNALRHTPAGGEVVLWASEEGDRVAMHVKDTGSGIPPHALPHVFKRFYRADSSRPSHGGSGIGLTIAKYFVEAQGGQIFVESTPGEGSHFWFTLLKPRTSKS